MIDTERFKIKRHELKDILHEFNPEEYEIELKIYDFIVNTCENNNSKVLHDLERLFEPIAKIKSADELPEILKDIKNEALFWKMLHKHDPAFFIIHDFGAEQGYDYDRHIGRFQKDLVGRNFFDRSVEKKLENLAYMDGATITDTQHKIYATQAHIINLDSKPVIAQHYKESVRRGYGPDNPRYYGFRQNVNTRHLSALYASFHLPKTIVYSLGERVEVKNEDGKLHRVEEGHIRRYANGLITFSTLDKESETVERNLEILRKEKH